MGTPDMGWDEAIRLLGLLRKDPGSWLTASVEGWDYPLSREDAVLRDLWDLEYAKTGPKNRKPYQRPFKAAAAESDRHGNAAGRTPAEVVALLRAVPDAEPDEKG